MEIPNITTKTDTEDAMRVTVTFRRDINPEWYDLLVRIKSGRARAEVVRNHLNLPRFQSAVKLSAQAPAVPAAPATLVGVVNEPEHLEIPSAEPILGGGRTISVAGVNSNTNSLPPVADGRFSDLEGVKKDSGLSEAPQKRGGMAEDMLSDDSKN